MITGGEGCGYKLGDWDFYRHFKMGFPKGCHAKESTCHCRRCKTQVQSLGQDDAPEQEMATHSSILAWKKPVNNGA